MDGEYNALATFSKFGIILVDLRHERWFGGGGRWLEKSYILKTLHVKCHR